MYFLRNLRVLICENLRENVFDNLLSTATLSLHPL